MEEYSLKVDLCVADVLIAATAVEKGLALATCNGKHFSVIQDLQVKVYRP